MQHFSIIVILMGSAPFGLDLFLSNAIKLIINFIIYFSIDLRGNGKKCYIESVFINLRLMIREFQFVVLNTVRNMLLPLIFLLLISRGAIGQGRDSHGRIPMGIMTPRCDMAEDPLELDGSLGPESYKCFRDESLFAPKPEIEPLLVVDHIPEHYMPWHICMNNSISYNKTIPTYGEHRTLWPRYGEYTFVPVQRWLHNLEHGAVVMLYHPCANSKEVKFLKQLVQRCLYQYVITALNKLSPERPLALVAWGASLELSKVDILEVFKFIKQRALKGPEDIDDDGQYYKNLIKPASKRFKGSDACPGIPLSSDE
ncbi:hypothetical protein HHI36_009297 [Cryptolaemus montrouzieri]|uniref:Uncharacterized protein n=1 Tax=Cryptolaemus montrouzieri TaxID=559131 RepID=A0ABD2MV36_9CUCU